MHTPPRTVTTALAGLCLSITALSASASDIFPQHPTLTPGGDFAVFSWAGDLWSVPTDGGAATRLTSHPALELHSAISPDGSRLAFTSDREGAQNIYVADLTRVGSTLVAGAPRRVTFADSGHNLSGFSHDGKAVLFSSFQDRDIFREERMFSAPLDGGPVQRLTDAFGEHPQVTRDGDAMVFARGSNNGVRPVYRGPATGELWMLEFDTGNFTRLTTSDADDIEPHTLPDGSVLFLSSADGQYNLHRTAPGERGTTQLTNFKPDARQTTIGHGARDLGVAHDGSAAVFAVWDTLYTLDLNARNARPQPIQLTISGDTTALDHARMDLDREATEAVLSPDGQTVAIVARGEIFVRSTAENHPTRRVTHAEARDQQIAWSPDGTRLYFVSDRDGAPNIYAATVALSRHDIEPEEAAEEDEQRKEELAEDSAEAAPETGDGEASDSDDAGNAETTDDDKKDDKADEDKKDEGPTPGDRWAQALQFEIEPVVTSDYTDQRPTPSPDGKALLFVRERGDLMLLDLESGDIATLETGWDEPDPAWASDSIHVVYSRNDLQFNRDIFLLDTHAARHEPGSDAARPVNITRHPDIDASPRLSHDGKVLYFLSDRDASSNWNYDVYMVFLDDSLEDLADYELAKYFEDAKKEAGKLKPLEVKPATEDGSEGADGAENGEGDKADAEAPEPLKFDTDDAFLRVRRLTSIPEAESDLAITPAGERVIFSSSPDDDRGLYSVDYRGRERKKITGGGVASVSTSLTGDKVLFVNAGQAKHAGPAGGEVKTLDIDAPVIIDTARERTLKFREGARVFGMMFYHNTMKDLDWQALSDRYEQLALNTRTGQAMNRVLSALFGEADGSHTGAFGGPSFSAPSPGVGLLAIDANPAGNGYEVTRVLRDGPADDGDKGLLEGDLITHINGQSVAPEGNLVDLRAAMLGTAGKETLVTVQRPGPNAGTDAAREVHLLLTPHSQGAETNMRYRDEVERREARVHELSNGRLGYLHIRGMGGPQVRDYERDLYAAAHGREGLIIDVRDNGGGWTTDILLASLTAPAHAYTIPRGADPADAEFDSYPRDRRLIHAYNRPLTVLLNENSYSNAEIFSHAIKTTGRGKLVGTQTHGAVISTGGHNLIDGTLVRIPFRGWFLPDGTDMEHNGAMPDIDVPMLPPDEAANHDPQLKVAVEDLLRRIDRGEN